MRLLSHLSNGLNESLITISLNLLIELVAGFVWRRLISIQIYLQVLSESWLKERPFNLLHFLHDTNFEAFIDQCAEETLELVDSEGLLLLILFSHSSVILLLYFVAIRDFLDFDLPNFGGFPLCFYRILHVINNGKQLLLLSLELYPDEVLEELARTPEPEPALDAYDKLVDFVSVPIAVFFELSEILYPRFFCTGEACLS